MNARLSDDLRRRLRAHFGAAIALHCCGFRVCFRVAADGKLRATSPLIDADAEIQWTADGETNVRGDGALLREMDEIRRVCDPRELAQEFFGAEGTQFLESAAKEAAAFVRGMPARCNWTATPAEVSAFARNAAQFNSDVSAAAARISRLEEKQ